MRYPVLVLLVAATSACLPVLEPGTAPLQVSNPGTSVFGVPMQVTVTHRDAQWRWCELSSLKGNGGCSGLTDTALTLEAVSCDDQACEVHPAISPSTPGTLELEVLALRPGTLVLHVKAAAASGGAHYEAVTELQTREATELRLTQLSDLTILAPFALLPGATADLEVQALAADGTQLAFPRQGAVSATMSGQAVSVSSDPHATDFLSLRAERPGESTLTVTLGHLSRTDTLRVAELSQVVDFEVRERKDTYVDFAQADALGPVVTTLTSSRTRFDKMVVLHLADGTLALGGANALTLEPAQVGSLDVYNPTSSDGPAAEAPSWVGTFGLSLDSQRMTPGQEAFLSLAMGGSTTRVPVLAPQP